MIITLYIPSIIIILFFVIRFGIKKKSGFSLQDFRIWEQYTYKSNYSFFCEKQNKEIIYIVVIKEFNNVVIVLFPDSKEEMILQNNSFYKENFGMNISYTLSDFSIKNHFWFFKKNEIVNHLCNKKKVEDLIITHLKQQND
jgi:hypothetical protein